MSSVEMSWLGLPVRLEEWILGTVGSLACSPPEVSLKHES